MAFNPTGGIFIPTIRTELSGTSLCFTNVHAYVKEHGGRARMGWLKSDDVLLGIIFTWLHHVVWESPDGKLFDITPQMNPKDRHNSSADLFSESVFFVPDDEAKLTVMSDGKLRSLPPQYTPVGMALHEAPGRLQQGILYLMEADRAHMRRNLNSERHWCAMAGRMLGADIHPHTDTGILTLHPFTFD